MADEKAVELYRKYRPKNFSEIVGQEGAVRKLATLGKQKKIPHVILFSGASGCGKTTLARILRKKLNCSDHDFKELNIGDYKGIDTIRNIREKMNLAPIAGDTRVYLLDEAHQLSPAAQDAILKILEDTPDHVYFFLCTTHPGKLKTTIRTRCEEIAVRLLKKDEIIALTRRVAESEGMVLTEMGADKISELAEGSARKALVLLHSLTGIEDEDQQIEVLSSSNAEAQANELGYVLMNPKGNLPRALKILRELDDEPEKVRHLVLIYVRKAYLNPKSTPATRERAYVVINAFRDNFYDSLEAGLIAACHEVLVG